jgi:hypothetical protein
MGCKTPIPNVASVSIDAVVGVDAANQLDQTKVGHEKPIVKSESGWYPLIGITGMLLLGYAIQHFAGKDRELTKLVFLWSLVGLGLLFCLYLSWGKSASETSGNLWTLTKYILGFLALVFALGGLGQCVGGSGKGSETGGVPDTWSRR